MALTWTTFLSLGSSSTATISNAQERFVVEMKKELIAESEEKSQRDLKLNQSETTSIERKIGFHYFWLPGSITIRLQEFLESIPFFATNAKFSHWKSAFYGSQLTLSKIFPQELLIKISNRDYIDQPSTACRILNYVLFVLLRRVVLGL